VLIRLVVARVATRTELYTVYGADDIMDLNDALDALEDAGGEPAEPVTEFPGAGA
jgi:hypothetical protein